MFSVDRRLLFKAPHLLLQITITNLLCGMSKGDRSNEGNRCSPTLETNECPAHRGQANHAGFCDLTDGVTWHLQVCFCFFFILILCKVTSYRQTTEDLDTVLTSFKTVTANNHLHGLLISNFTSRYTQVLLTQVLLILLVHWPQQQSVRCAIPYGLKGSPRPSLAPLP